MENLLETALGILIIVVSAVGICRIAWAVLEVPYRVTIIIGCTICLGALTLWDCLIWLWKLINVRHPR